ncbi:hypothetical protein QFZ99_000866 [Paraburkholderia atlantica]|uniref:hypothetical protein n=1 Tax=Paraburkholderia atlantica TaxID=2654982 RepID=UPI003D2037D8
MSLRGSAMSYSDDRLWSDQYIPAICQIVGPYLLTPAPLEVDQKQATDLIVLKGHDMMIAARVRRAEYARRYPFDFTLRCKRDNGSETELTKIFHGWADWLFYGFAHETQGAVIARWFLVDLDEFRFELTRIGYRRPWRTLCERHDNGDGTHFIAFDVRRFSTAVIASSDSVAPLADFET